MKHFSTIIFMLLAASSLLVSALSIASEPIEPIPIIPVNSEQAEIGRLLFSDVRLSKDNKTSCASCHQLDQGGADTVSRSIGFDGQPLKRNTPTIYNSALNFAQMWDGRINDLETRVELAVISPKLMGMPSWDEAVAKIQAVSFYDNAFKQAYQETINAKNIQHSIAEYQRSLVLVNSPFDRFLRGDVTAISPQAKQGYELFKAYGCASCHQGANVGGNMFQKFGVLKKIDWKKWKDDDLGRYAISGKEWDKHVFKVPSLRLVVKTAPYFHNGSVNDLKAAIDRMTTYQLDRPVPDVDKEAIIAFLHTLPGKLPKQSQDQSSNSPPSTKNIQTGNITQGAAQ